jgi:hypothetical protein
MKTTLGHITIVAAALSIAVPAFAQTSSSHKGASEYAPGKNKQPGQSAKEYAPGQAPGPANKAAPGQQMHNESSPAGSSSGSSTGTGSDSGSRSGSQKMQGGGKDAD